MTKSVKRNDIHVRFVKTVFKFVLLFDGKTVHTYASEYDSPTGPKHAG